MLSGFWHWFIIILTIGSILACWWLLQWTKGISNRDEESGTGSTGHVWDEDLVELNNPLPRWWLQLFHITLIFSLVYLVLYPGLGNVKGILGWSQDGQYDEQMAAAVEAQEAIFARYKELDNAALIADSEANATGRRLFSNSCAMCHGSDARGAKGFPNLADNDWLYGNDFDTVYQTITNGRSGMMPPMGAGLEDTAVNQLVAYVQSMSGMQVDSGEAAAGKANFDMLCAACHGVDGAGNQALGAPRLNDEIWLYGSDSETIATTITQGRSGNMPAHENLLSDERRRLLAAYVLSLSQSSEP
jgi:cytochrome c oxidase cbb3-type subunit 3